MKRANHKENLLAMNDGAATDAAEYIEKMERLYDKVNQMLSPLGANGEIYATDDRVIAVMDALYDIDGGQYSPMTDE